MTFKIGDKVIPTEQMKRDWERDFPNPENYGYDITRGILKGAIIESIDRHRNNNFINITYKTKNGRIARFTLNESQLQLMLPHNLNELVMNAQETS